MTLDTNDIAALAYLGRRIRDNLHGAPKWDEPGIAAHIRRLADRGYSLDACLDQLINHARDRSAKTPGVLGHPISTQPVEETRHPHPVKAHEACPRHPGGRAGTCTSCAADRLAPEHDDQVDVMPADQARDLARAALTKAAP